MECHECLPGFYYEPITKSCIDCGGEGKKCRKKFTQDLFLSCFQTGLVYGIDSIDFNFLFHLPQMYILFK